MFLLNRIIKSYEKLNEFSIYLFTLFLTLPFSDVVLAQHSFKTPVENLKREAKTIATGMILVGFFISSIYFSLSKKDAHEKLSNAIMGLVTALAAGTCLAVGYRIFGRG